MSPATRDRILTGLLFDISLLQAPVEDLGMDEYVLITDLLGQKMRLEQRFRLHLRDLISLSDDEIETQTEVLGTAAQHLKDLFSAKNKEKNAVRTDFLNKMMPAPENKTMMLKRKADMLRERVESTARRLSDAKRRKDEAISSMRKAEEDFDLELITRGEVDAAQRASADAVLAIAPIEAELSADHERLERLGRLLRQEIEKEQVALGHQKLSEHRIERRELARELPSIIARMKRMAGIDAGIRSACPKAQKELVKRIPGTGGSVWDVSAPGQAVRELENWLEALRAVCPEDMSDEASELLDSNDAARAEQIRADRERGERIRAQQDGALAHRSPTAADIISRQ